MRKLRWLILILVLTLLPLWLLGCFAPDPKVAIARKLKKLTQLASFTPNEPSFQRFGKIKQLGGFFAEDVSVAIDTADVENRTLHGRDAVMQAMVGAKALGSGLTAEFLDMNIDVGSGKKSALVDLTLKARFGGGEPGDSDMIAQEMQFTLKLTNGDWYITRVETVHTLKP